MAGEGQKQASRSPQPPAAARSRPQQPNRGRQEARERSQRVHGLCSLSPFAQRGRRVEVRFLHNGRDRWFVGEVLTKALADGESDTNEESGCEYEVWFQADRTERCRFGAESWCKEWRCATPLSRILSSLKSYKSK